MAHICHTCGRGAQTGFTRSKSMIATKVRRQVNLQPRRVNGTRAWICTRCLRTLKSKSKAV